MTWDINCVGVADKGNGPAENDYFCFYDYDVTVYDDSVNARIPTR